MKAVHSRTVKTQMKCVVSDLETVVGELNGVTKELRTLLQHIDRVTYALLQGCEHGLRSPELEEATYKSLVPKPTEADFLNNFSSYPLDSTTTDKDPRPPVQETDFPVHEASASLKRSKDPMRGKGRGAVPGCANPSPSTGGIKSSMSPKGRLKTASEHNERRTRFCQERKTASKYVGMLSDSHCVGIQQRKLLDKMKSRENPFSEQVSLKGKKSSFKSPDKVRFRSQRTKRDNKEMPAPIETDNRLSQRLVQRSRADLKGKCRGEENMCLITAQSTETTQEFPTKHITQPSGTGTTDTRCEPKREQAGTNTKVTPQWRARLQENVYRSDSVDSSEGGKSVNEYRSSDSEQDNKSTPLFSSPMHISVPLERTDSEKGALLHDFEANYNRNINTWTTYALVHIDNASEEEALLLQNSEEGEDIEEDEDDDSEETHPEPKGLNVDIHT